MLEESVKRTLLGLIGIQLNKNITIDRTEVDDADISSAFKSMFNDDSLQLYDHFGSTDVDVVTNRIRYMVQALEVEWIILDHISILVSGLATHDERKLIDMAMTKLRTIVQELNIGMIVVSHLRRPDGDKGHERWSAGRGLFSLGVHTQLHSLVTSVCPSSATKNYTKA